MQEAPTLPKTMAIVVQQMIFAMEHTPQFNGEYSKKLISSRRGGQMLPTKQGFAGARDACEKHSWRHASIEH